MTAGLRVAHVISTVEGVGGAERTLAAVVSAGDERGWQQVVLNPFVDEVSSAFLEVRRDGRYEGRPCRRLSELPGLRRWLHGKLSVYRPDVVHVVLFQALVTVASLRRTRGAKWVSTHTYGEGIRLPPHGWAKEWIDRWAGRRFDRVVAVSEVGRQLLLERYRYHPEKVVLIPPGWGGEPLPPTRPSGSRDAPTVVCVAKLRPEKGHDVLLAALAIVRRQLPSVRLRLVGDGQMRPALSRQVDDLGLRDNVEFTGDVPEVWAHLADADVFALASQSEAFGIAIVEAMAAGLPVVAPAVGGIPALVRPGVSGELFPPGDHEALAALLVRLLTSPEMRARMGSAGRQMAAGHRIENTARRYCELFECLYGGVAQG